MICYDLPSYMKPKVIAIVGTTSAGKTGLSLQLAKAFNGEIISADSRQIYHGMNIGTGKILPNEMVGIPHHMIDVADPKNQYSVAQYKQEAEITLQSILTNEHIPFIVGGTGLYVSALLDGIVLPEVPPNAELRKELEQETASELFALLKTKDPRRAETIDPENPRRLIRALEIVEAIGTVPEQHAESPYDILWIGLELPKEELQQKIRERIHIMISNGLIQEVETLLNNGVTHERLQEIGLDYRHVSLYLQGKYASLDEMANDLAIKTNQYAKRQLTWFKRNANIHWFNPNLDKQKIHQLVTDFLIS